MILEYYLVIWYVTLDESFFRNIYVYYLKIRVFSKNMFCALSYRSALSICIELQIRIYKIVFIMKMRYIHAYWITKLKHIHSLGEEKKKESEKKVHDNRTQLHRWFQFLGNKGTHQLYFHKTSYFVWYIKNIFFNTLWYEFYYLFLTQKETTYSERKFSNKRYLFFGLDW